MSVQVGNRIAINVIFLVDTSSPHTFLTCYHLDALLGEDNPIPGSLIVTINGISVHANQTILTCHILVISMSLE